MTLKRVAIQPANTEKKPTKVTAAAVSAEDASYDAASYGYGDSYSYGEAYGSAHGSGYGDALYGGYGDVGYGDCFYGGDRYGS